MSTTVNTPDTVTAADIHKLSDDVLLNQTQAANVLGLKPNTLNCWRANGRYGLRFVRVGRSVRYRVGDLRAWIESRTAAR